MKTGTKTTYIFLERSVEDKALLCELNNIIEELGIKSIRKFIKKYPLLYELKHKLKMEIEDL